MIIIIFSEDCWRSTTAKFCVSLCLFVSHLFVDNIVVHSVELRRIMEKLDVSFQAKI